MKKLFSRLVSFLALGCCVGSVQAAPVTLLPGTVNGALTVTDIRSTSGSFTTGDGFLSLTALKGGSATDMVFSGRSGRLGVSNAAPAALIGNIGGIDDPTSASTGFGAGNPDGEAMRFQFNTVGLDQGALAGLAWDFSRADGTGTTAALQTSSATANDGVFISGFLSDPGAVLTNSVATATYASGTLQLVLPGGEFNSTLRSVAFSNLAASAGQTLNLWATDSDQGGAQFAIRNIVYDTVAVPEPTSLSVLALSTGALTLVTRRGRKAV